MELNRPFDSLWPISSGDPALVARAINDILAPRFPQGWDRAFMEEAFRAAARAYAGSEPGLIACDTPYHDLRHSLETALATARLIDGWEITHGESGRSLGPTIAMTGVVLALLHDIGFLRRTAERSIPGGALTAWHEARAAEYARRYLGSTPLAPLADLAGLIDATRIGTHIEELAGDERHLVVARMLATADLVSQLADRFYLEKCRDFLYAEFIEAGIAQGPGPRNPNAYYTSPEDLLRKTPAFCHKHVLLRLDGDLSSVHRMFAAHFGGENPYCAAIARNVDFLEKVVASGEFHRLRRKPKAMLWAP